MQENAPGALASRLSADAAQVQLVTGPQVGVVVQSYFAVLFALGIAFYSSWQLTLVVIGVMPAMALGGMAKGKQMSQSTHATVLCDPCRSEL